MTEVSYHS